MSKNTDSGGFGLGRNSQNRPSLFTWLRGRFFAGVVVVAPIAATVFLTYSFVTFVDARMKPLIRSAFPEGFRDTQLGGIVDAVIAAIPGLGILFAVVALTIIGAVAANLFGRSMLSLSERVVNRVPLVSTVYSTLKQIVETLAGSHQASFKEVVMVEYPKTGTWAVGFITSQAQGDVANQLSDTPHVGVFVPTTPNPTSGFLIYVPEAEIRRLDISVEEGAKLIISAGLVVPPAKPAVEAITENVGEKSA